MGTTATGAQNIVMLGLEQQIAGQNTGAPLPFDVASSPPGAPTAATGSGTGITSASLKYGLKAWIKGRGLTAVGTKSSAVTPSDDDVELSWTALADSTGCYGYRVMRTEDDGTTWVAVTDVWGRTTVAYTDTTAIGSEPDLDDPTGDETALNYGLVQVSHEAAQVFTRVDGEFASAELTGELGEPDAIPGFMTVPVELPCDLRAGVAVAVEATFFGTPTETPLSGAPGMQYDLPTTDTPDDQVALWGLEYPGGSTRPHTGMGAKFFDLEYSGLGTGLAKLKAKGLATGWTEAGLGAADGANTGTYKHLPVVKGQRGDTAAYTSDLEHQIISVSGGVLTWKTKVGAASYGGSGTVRTGYYDTSTGRMIQGGTNDEPFVELVDQDGNILGIDDDENREPFSIYWPGDVRTLAVGDKFTTRALALIPRALLSVGDTTSTGDVRRIVRLPRFGPAHVRLLKTVDSVQSLFDFESATVKLSRSGTYAYQPGAAAKRPCDIDVTGYVGVEFDLDGRYKTREIERLQRQSERFVLALEINGGRIASAPGVLTAHRESIKKTFTWCRISSFSAPPTGPGLTKYKLKIMAAAPPDGSAFMSLNRIVSKQTWPFYAT